MTEERFASKSENRRGSRVAQGDAFERLLFESLSRTMAGADYEIAWKEKWRYAGRISPLSGNREEPHTDYQVDLVVTRPVRVQPGENAAERIPLVAIEAKVRGTTDETMTASQKAQELRSSYPWLRFGYVVNFSYLTQKWIWHGRTFDFILCVKGLDRASLDSRLGHVVRREIEFAEGGVEILGGSHQEHREYPDKPLGPRPGTSPP